MRQLIFSLFFFLTLLCKIEAQDVLKVGMELADPPFETVDQNGKPMGISVDIAYALGKYLGREVVIENIPFIGLIPSLKAKKIDLIISSMTADEKRRRSIAFSHPYLKTGLCLLISQKSTMQSIKDADQEGRVIVVKQSTTGQQWAETNLTHAKVHVLDKETSCILEVVQGKADAFIYDQFSVYSAWKKNPDTTRADLMPFVFEEWAIGLRQEDKKLLGQVNAFIKKFRKEGGFEKLGDTYLKSQKEDFEKLGVPFYL